MSGFKSIHNQGRACSALQILVSDMQRSGEEIGDILINSAYAMASSQQECEDEQLRETLMRLQQLVEADRMMNHLH